MIDRYKNTHKLNVTCKLRPVILPKADELKGLDDRNKLK